ncbi:MAG TPA: hypothetical protein VEY71_00690 [Chitinophagales bacterium]|nr:hypothetical protein [Chitinophagales bacterium]
MTATKPFSVQDFDYGSASASRIVKYRGQAGYFTALFFGSFFCAGKRKNGGKKTAITMSYLK